MSGPTIRLGGSLWVGLIIFSGLSSVLIAQQDGPVVMARHFQDSTIPPSVPELTRQAEDISPSDQSIQLEDILGQEPEQPGESVVPRQDSLTPEQSRALSSVVTAVDVRMEDIGTGIIPEPAAKYADAEQVWLPDGVDRGATFKSAQWRPSMICHNPLYFEDAMLERHGHNRWGCLLPVASGTKALGTLVLMPYLRTLQPYCQKRYALGHYRAGSCAPLLRDGIPWDKRAAAVEVAFWGGFFWVAPL